MDAISAAAFGVVLAACAGLRAFLPLFSASLGAQVFEIALPRYLEWLDRPETLVLFGVATLLELLGDKIPLVDHLLDSVQTLTKPVVGALAATPFLYQLSPGYAVAIGIIVGAPLALGVHAAKATARAGSTATTGGLANPALSILEDVAAGTAVAVAFIAPLLALALLVGLLFVLYRLVRKARGR